MTDTLVSRASDSENNDGISGLAGARGKGNYFQFGLMDCLVPTNGTGRHPSGS